MLYVLIVLQISVGFGMVIIAQNAYLTGSEQLREWKNRFTNTEYLIKYATTKSKTQLDYVHPDVVNEVAVQYEDQASVMYAALYHVEGYIDNSFEAIQFLVLSSQAMNHYLGQLEDSVLIDPELYSRIRSTLHNMPGIQEKDGRLQIQESQWPLTVKELPNTMIDFSTSKDQQGAVANRFALDEVVIVPMDAWKEFAKFPESFGEALVFGVQLYDLIRVKPINGGESVVKEIRDAINQETSEGVQYIVQNVIGDITHSIQFAEAEVRQRDTYAKIGLISTVIGTIGVMWIQLQRRKKDIAICIMLGSTLRDRWKELVLECGWVIGLGIICANLLAIRFNSLGDSLSFVSRIHYQSILYSFMGGLAILFIVSVMMLAPVKNMDPIQILTEEGR